MHDVTLPVPDLTGPHTEVEVVRATADTGTRVPAGRMLSRIWPGRCHRRDCIQPTDRRGVRWWEGHRCGWSIQTPWYLRHGGDRRISWDGLGYGGIEER
jgi:hypothetical protein